MVVSSVLNDNKSVLVACVDAGFLTSDQIYYNTFATSLPCHKLNLEHYGYAEVCQQLGLRRLNHQSPSSAIASGQPRCTDCGIRPHQHQCRR